MRLFILLTVIVCSPSTASAAHGKQTAIDQCQVYLQELKSLALEFRQTDSQGGKAAGKLLIHKPYKFRFNYYAPHPMVIVGNKNYVSIYDYEMEQLTRIKSKDNIFNFLLTDDLAVSKHFMVKSAISQDDVFAITLYHPPTERLSEITFAKTTKFLKSIKIFEGSNVITLTFSASHKVANFDDSLFILKNPDIFGVPTRLSKQAIESKYQIAN